MEKNQKTTQNQSKKQDSRFIFVSKANPIFQNSRFAKGKEWK